MIPSPPKPSPFICLAYVGRGSHRYVAGTCRRFRAAYSALFPGAKRIRPSGEEPPLRDSGYEHKNDAKGDHSGSAVPGAAEITGDGEGRGQQAAFGGGGTFVTFWSSAAASIPCAKLCLDDAPGGGEGRWRWFLDETRGGVEKRGSGADASAARLIAEAAALGGNLEVLQWLETCGVLDAKSDSLKQRPDNLSFSFAQLMSKPNPRFSICDWKQSWRLVDYAALRGNLHVIRHLVRRGSVCDAMTGLAAATGGSVDVLRYLAEEKSVPLEYACVAAARGGHVASLEFLHGTGMKMHTPAFVAACQGGHIVAAKWLVDKLGRISMLYSRDATVAAANSGKLELVILLRENAGLRLHPSMMEAAASKGYLDLVQYLFENGCQWTPGNCICAAMRGHLEVLQYAHSKVCSLDGAGAVYHLACDHSRFRHFSVLQFLKEIGFPWGEQMISKAASCGNMELVKFLLRNDCPLGPCTCAAAAERGNLSIVKWLHEHGCPWDSQTIRAAEEGGYSELATWARENGCPEYG